MRIREQRNRWYPGAVALGLLCGLPHVALGQTTTVDVSGAASDTEVLEEVVIVGTGTSIRGIAPVGSEPIAYGRADIEADSPVDIRDALSNVPQIGNFGTDADQSTSNRFRTAGYQPIIHNLGIYSTLTLFNGHRMAEVGGEAVFPDPAILPTIAVERVDVIADGASAIYGSDAVAGVVNFLYRRGVEGFEVSMTEGYDPDTSWANRNIGALWGHRFDRGEIMVAYEYSKHDRPTQSEFPFTANADHRSRGGSDLRLTNQNCEYPQVTYGGTNYRGPNRTTPTYSCSPNGPVHLASNGERHAALVTARYKVTDNVELWSEFNFSDYKAWAIATWGNGGRWQVNVPSTSPNFYRPPTHANQTLTTELNRGDGVGVFGHRRRVTNSRVHGGTFGMDIDMGNDWQTSVLLHKSRTFDYINDPGLDIQNLGTLLISGQFNPWDLTGNPASVKNQINNGFTQLNDASQTLSELTVKLDGPLFEITGGDVLAAFGASHRTQRVQQLQSGGCVTCSFYQVVRNDDIERGVNALFAELAIPLVGATNGKPGIEKLTLSLAGRYDDYDGLDSQFNPKIGFDWTVINGLRFFGNWGTSYVAPNMGLITAIFGVPQPGISDRVGSSSTNSALDIYNLGGGNPDLEPEEAESFSFGVNWSPDIIQGLSMGVTYYEVEYSNLIYKPTRADVLRNPAFVASRILGQQDPNNPNLYLPLDAAYVAQLIAAAPPQTPITPGQTFNMSFNSFAINLGTRNHAGVDINLQYDFDTSIGKWGLGVVANKQTKFDETVVPGSASFSRIGTGDAPPWAVSTRVNWGANNLPLRLSLTSNYKSGYQDAGFAPTDSYLAHNFTVAYDFENLLRGVTAQIRVRNLTDETPPFYNVEEGYDDDNHTPYGRQYDLTLRMKF